MSGRAQSPVSRVAASVTALAACCLALTNPVTAQEPEASEERAAPQVRITTTGVYSSYQPRAEIHLSRAAHVAVFEVEPGVGALRMYPFSSDRSMRAEAGTHVFRLNGVRAANLREQFLARLGHRLRTRVEDYPEAYLLAVASDRPLRFSELSSGRVFAYHGGGIGGSGGVGSVVAALFDRLLPEVGAGDWSYDLHSYSKTRDPGLVAGLGAASDPFAELGAYNCLGYGTGALGFPSFGYFPGAGFGAHGFGYGLHGADLRFGARSASQVMQVALSPVNRTTCRGFGFVFNRLAFGFGGLGSDGPVVFRPHTPPQPEEPAEGDDEADEGPKAERYHGPLLEAGEATEREAVLRRIADARAEGRVTAKQVQGLVREGRLELPSTVTERMRVQAFRHHRALERRDRERWRARSWQRDRRSTFSVPSGLFDRGAFDRDALRRNRGSAFGGGHGVDRPGPVFRARPDRRPSQSRPARSPRPKSSADRTSSGNGEG